MNSDDNELRKASEGAFTKWYDSIQEGDLLRFTTDGTPNDRETLMRAAWLAAVDWADGKTIVGAIPGGEEGSPGLQIVACIKIRTLARDGQHTAQTVVCSGVNEEGRLSLDMPSLLVAGCGETVKKVLDKMGYVNNGAGHMVLPEEPAGPEGKVM